MNGVVNHMFAEAGEEPGGSIQDTPFHAVDIDQSLCGAGAIRFAGYHCRERNKASYTAHRQFAGELEIRNARDRVYSIAPSLPLALY
jgi:hypothetical protein